MLRRRPEARYLAIFFIAIVARVIPGPRTVDDAYITFRYAQNILDHQGMVYNPGERVLGTTTPLYTGILAIIGIFAGGSGAPFPWIALVLNSLADGLTCILLMKLGELVGHRRAGIAAAVIWAIAPMSVTFAIGGMETSLFVLLMTGTFYFYSNQRPVATALCASFSLITRPDALLFVAPIGLARVLESPPLARKTRDLIPIGRRELAAFILPGAIWGSFATLYFGSPIPLSVVAKVNAYHLSPGESLIRLLQHISTPFLGHLTFGTNWIKVGFLLFPVLFGLGALTTLRKHRRWWPIFIFPWVYLAAYSIANPLIFRWYLTPPLPIYFLGIFLGGERITLDTRSKLPVLGLSIAAILMTLNGWTVSPDHGPDRPAPKMAFIKLELLYEKIGKELAPQVTTDEVVAAGDIGALGYYSGARILDTVGLISPEVAHYYPLDDSYYVINYAIAPDLILHELPNFLVSPEVYIRDSLLNDPTFNQLYQLQETLETDIYGSEGMLVFHRDEGQ